MKKSRIIAAHIYILLIVSTVVSAAPVFVYTYTGKNFNEFSTPTTFNNQFISIYFSLNTQIAANLVNQDMENLIVDSTFANGVFPQTFNISTDNNGAITGWDISQDYLFPGFTVVGHGKDYLYTKKVGNIIEDYNSYEDCIGDPSGPCDMGTFVDFGKVVNNAGTWAVTTVPVPASAWLFCSGLLGLTGIGKWKKRFVSST